MVPFQQSRQPELGQRGLARSDTVNDITRNNYRPLIPADTDRRYAQLMRDLWATSPADRPTAQQAADRLFKMLVTDFGVDVSHSTSPLGGVRDDEDSSANGSSSSSRALGNDSFVVIEREDDASVTKQVLAASSLHVNDPNGYGIHSSSTVHEQSDRSVAAAAAAFRHSSRATPSSPPLT
jgi:hypothetical protein